MHTLRENIDWVGYVDWSVRDFHSYDTVRGATYNAYLVRDEKTALIDTVKGPYFEDLLHKIATLKPLDQVDYVICNHAEPDHSGALPEVMKALPNATLVANKKCHDALAAHYDTTGWRIMTVKSGDSLSLGRRTLQFIDTPMVHWPESMFTYVPEEKLLFSMDAFGQHYASSERFDDENPLCTVMEEAKKYYANIVMPYGKMVKATLGKVGGLPIEIIAPSHGVIWRKYLGTILEAYQSWMECRAKAKVIILYDSMWESTAAMADAILEGATQPGVHAKLIAVRRSNLTEIAAEMLDAAAVAIGSSTLNSGMMPMMAAVLCYLEGLHPKDKAAFAFGSYGWGRGATEAIEGKINGLGWKLLREALTSRYKPTPAILDECRKAGELLAETAKSTAGDRHPGTLVCVDP